MNYKELIGLLEKHYENLEYFAYDDPQKPKLITEEIGEMVEVAQKGGEGEGDEWYAVKHFPKHDIYVRIDSFYASYNGTTFDGWEDCKEVKPIEKTIKVYE